MKTEQMIPRPPSLVYCICISCQNSVPFVPGLYDMFPPAGSPPLGVENATMYGPGLASPLIVASAFVSGILAPVVPSQAGESSRVRTLCPGAAVTHITRRPLKKSIQMPTAFQGPPNHTLPLPPPRPARHLDTTTLPTPPPSTPRPCPSPAPAPRRAPASPWSAPC